MFAKSLKWRDGDDLAVDVDGDHAGGGWSPPEVDSGGVSPLQSSPAAAFCLSISGFVFLRSHLAKLPGGQDGDVEMKIDGIGGSRPKMGGPRRPGTGAMWATLFWPSDLRLLAAFAPRSSSKKTMPVNFQLIMT